MKMMKCPECGKEISKKLDSCPECGYVFDEIDLKEINANGKRSVEKKRHLIIGLIIICLIIGTGVIYKNNSVPNVTNMEFAEAAKILKTHKISYDTFYDYSDTCDKDVVFSQSVKAYTLYKAGTKVKLGISSGRNYTMPDIVGKNIEEVNSQIQNMPIEITYSYTDEFEKDVVAESSIEVGEKFNETSDAEIVVSSGKFQDVPELIGLSEEEGKNTLDEGGFKYKIKEEYSDQDPGIIYKYYPKKCGDKEKTTIAVYVSKGAGVAVPYVVGFSASDAQQKLQEAGFGCNIVSSYSDLRTLPDNVSVDMITSQDIDGRVDDPCEITLTINKPAIKILSVNFESNYVGGIDTYINFQNISDKQIAYVVFDMKYFDRMGYPARCQIRGTSNMNLQYTGPLNAGATSGKQYWDAVIYDSSVAAVMPKSATITFADNTKQTLTYGGTYWSSKEYYGGNLHD